MRIRNCVLIAWLLMPLAGCASIHDSHYEHTQKARARAAWRGLPACAKRHRYHHDYEYGWKDGFYDVATGGTGCPPIVAPQRYWDPSQILEDCDNRRYAYYEGFQDGAAYASQFPDTHHLKMWSSCECPLPTCENCCSSLAVCPTGSCGFSVYSDTEGVPLPPSAIDGSVIDEAPIGSSMIEQSPSDIVPRVRDASPGAPAIDSRAEAATDEMISDAEPDLAGPASVAKPAQPSAVADRGLEANATAQSLPARPTVLVPAATTSRPATVNPAPAVVIPAPAVTAQATPASEQVRPAVTSTVAASDQPATELRPSQTPNSGRVDVRKLGPLTTVQATPGLIEMTDFNPIEASDRANQSVGQVQPLPQAVPAVTGGMTDQPTVIEAEPIRVSDSTPDPLIRLATEIQLPPAQ